MPTKTTKTPQVPKEDVHQTSHATHWIQSQEGQRTIAKSLKQAQTMSAQFSEAQRINPESLYKPVTL